jgi:shikimate dehydrogenase
MTMHVLYRNRDRLYLDQAWPDVASSVGAYHAEAYGARMFSRIDGDWFSVLGMPLLDVLSFCGFEGGLRHDDQGHSARRRDRRSRGTQPVAEIAWSLAEALWLRGHYIPMRVAQSDLVQVLRTLPLMGFKGVNVTIPHKEHVLSLADSVTDRAALIGAANTLTFTSQGRIQADNTDGSGFISNIRQSDSGMDRLPGPRGRPGKRRRGEGDRLGAAQRWRAGGSCGEPDPCPRGRAEGPVRRQRWFRRTGRDPGACARGRADREHDLAWHAGPTTPVRGSLRASKPMTVVTDIVYTPLRTQLLEHAEKHGCQTVDGLGMLLHQAVPGFERWFSYTPTVDDELRNAVLA